MKGLSTLQAERRMEERLQSAHDRLKEAKQEMRDEWRDDVGGEATKVARQLRDEALANVKQLTLEIR